MERHYMERRMNDKWDNGKPKNGKPKKSWDCAIRYNNPIGEIARDALLAESASGGLSRMQFFNLIAVERVEHTHWLA